MEKITTTTKPNGSGRNWLEVGHFVDDEFGHSNWIKKGDPNSGSVPDPDKIISLRSK